MRAEILTVGTELLLGHTVDTNSAFLSRVLAELGFVLYYKATAGDNRQRVAEAIRQALGRVELLLITGGLGPTQDDITREAVAQATGRELELRPELLEQIEARFRQLGVPMSANNRRQAYLPRGAHAIPNPVGSAPAFFLELEGRAVACLPGVPSEMVYLVEQALVPLLRERLPTRSTIHSRLLRVVGLPESRTDELLGELMQASNPTVGLSAQTGEILVRVTARAASPEEAEAIMGPVVAEVRARLGEHVLEEGAESLAGALLARLAGRGLSLGSLETFTGGLLAQKLSLAPPSGTYRGGLVLPHWAGDPLEAAQAARGPTGSAWGLALVERDGAARVGLLGPSVPLVADPGYDRALPERYRTWAVNYALRLAWERAAQG